MTTNEDINAEEVDVNGKNQFDELVEVIDVCQFVIQVYV